MSFFARLRLAACVLLARTPREWRNLEKACAGWALVAGYDAIMVELARLDAHEAAVAQLLAGTRTTATAEALVAQARRLTATPAPPAA